MNAPDLASQQIAQAYDDRPYNSNAFFYAAPGHLRAAAHLYGVSSVPLAKARVLELGCSAGGNLLPFALAYPEAQVVGVDLSAVQVEAGRQAAAAVGATNLDLRAMSLTDITPEFGQFDYIIAHGVFSWVPPEVRDAMLRLCRENLSAEGIAYISYNTYPGWKAGDIVRDAMLLHSHGKETMEDRLGSAKAMLTLLSDGLAASNPLAPSLKAAVQQLRRFSDYYIAHEYLETFNSPCYFVEFADAVQRAGLGYVGDAEPQTELSAVFGQNVQLNQSLVALGQPKIMRQQYLDFAIGRNFRKSLITHADRAAAALSTPELDNVSGLHIAGYFTSEPRNEAQPQMRPFKNSRGRPLQTREAPVLAVIDVLNQAWPRACGQDDLVAGTAGKTGLDGEAHAAAVLQATQTLVKLGMVYVSLGDTPPSLEHAAGPRLLPGLAHLWQRSQDPAVAVGIGGFNAWHDVVDLRLKPAEAWIASRLDGRLSATELRTQLREALQRGTVPGLDGKPLTGQRNLDATAQKILNGALDMLARVGVRTH